MGQSQQSNVILPSSKPASAKPGLDRGFAKHDTAALALMAPDSQAGVAPSPGLVSVPVLSIPSVTLKMPGNLLSHGRFAAGTYWRAFASIACTVGTCAARPAD